MPATPWMQAAYDVHTTSNYPSRNYGSYKDLRVDTGSPSRLSYLYWSLPALAGQTVVAATLRLYEKEKATGGTRTLTAELLSAGFTESKLNANNAPGVVPSGPTGTATQATDATTSNRMWELDVTTLIQSVASGTPWFGLRLTSSNGTMLQLHSSESTSAYRPVLQITFAGPPQIPATLSPGGGRAISVIRPLHRFSFVDTPGDTQSAFQIQWSASSDFTTTTLDTGTVLSTLPQWEPTADTTVGTTRWWRVKTRDVAGLWSPWSEPVSFVRTAKGAVTITNPAVAPNNIVSEPTPPIGWTTSHTQAAWQVFILDDATGAVLHDSTKRSGTETAYTPPAGVLTQTDRDYRVVVRSWDDVARESIPGDPAYVEAQRMFTLDLAGAGPVTDLAAATVGDTPEVTLTWTRTTAPDFWALMVDGEFYGEYIDGLDPLVSGTSYSLTWWGARPRTDMAVTMVPVVNGEAVPGGNVVTVHTNPTGIWLSGTEGEDAICIATDGDLGDWSSTQLEAVHQPVGSPYAIIRRQNLGSRWCSQEGVLESGTDLQESIARANRLRASGTLLRLVLTGTNLVGRVTNMPPVDPEGEFLQGAGIKFDFYEQAQ